MQLKRHSHGFTLTELAVVMTILALLLATGMMTLSAQTEARNNEEAARRINAAVDALVGFAITNRRLPCPASPNTTGDEDPIAGTGACTTWYGGFVPGKTIGLQPTDSQGYAVDPWGNRLRYAVANLITGCTGTSTTPHFTSAANLKANGVSCRPNDLDICQSSTGINAVSCNTATRVASAQTIAFIVFSTGKNGAVAAGYGPDEIANTDGDRVFVTRTYGTSETGGGAFDDVMVVVPAGVLYSKLVTAGVLP
jgi:prepilin-type N-terminal cleavage/methylation domain-containing protein